MDRKFTEFVAQNGPLFKKPKRIDRLNLEDTTLTTHKWTTKICNGELETLPIIVEKGETDEEEVPTESSEPKETENDADTPSLLTSIVASPSIDETRVPVNDSLASSSSCADLSCIFTNTTHSVHSFRESEFETMFSNTSFTQINPQTTKNPTIESFDSSSDEEIDNYFKFRISLPARKFGQTSCNLQTAEAKIELIGPAADSQISPPTTSQKEDAPNTEELKEVASDSEMVVATMEADFSDAGSEENLLLSRRISQPLNLRYSSHEVEDTVKVLSHTTSFMNFVSDQLGNIVDDVPTQASSSTDEPADAEGNSAALKSSQECRVDCEGGREKVERQIQAVEKKSSTTEASSSSAQFIAKLSKPPKPQEVLSDPADMEKLKKSFQKVPDEESEDL